jgi:hypothetical protein
VRIEKLEPSPNAPTTITNETTERNLRLSVTNQQGWYQEIKYEETIILLYAMQVETIFNVTIRLLPIFAPKIAPIVLQSGQTNILNLTMESNNHTLLAFATSFTPNINVSIVIDHVKSELI